MNPTLTALGLTPDIIARYAHVLPPVWARIKHADGWRAAQTERRAARKAMGLNVDTGQPLQRSPNGTRKERKK